MQTFGDFLVVLCDCQFDKFINFIESEIPNLSIKRGHLGKKDSFRLKQILYYKKDAEKPNYTQCQYPVIDLMFSLVVAGSQRGS